MVHSGCGVALQDGLFEEWCSRAEQAKPCLQMAMKYWISARTCTGTANQQRELFHMLTAATANLKDGTDKHLHHQATPSCLQCGQAAVA